MFGLIFGTSFGAAQWLVLRRHLWPAYAWIGATLVGFVVGGVVVFGLLNGSEPGTSLITKLGHALVLGSSLGLAQWPVLRGKLDGGRLWITISVAAWVAAELVGLALTSVVGAPFDLLGLLLVGGTLPGAGMAWLLRRAPQGL